MKIYRGPSTKPFEDDTHELVSEISPEDLENSIAKDSYIRFNITKEINERQAVCTARFDSKDIVPMVNGVMSKLELQQTALSKIKKIMTKSAFSDKKKIEEIQKVIETI